jgi:hypothetical protein
MRDAALWTNRGGKLMGAAVAEPGRTRGELLAALSPGIPCKLRVRQSFSRSTNPRTSSCIT